MNDAGVILKAAEAMLAWECGRRVKTADRIMDEYLASVGRTSTREWKQLADEVADKAKELRRRQGLPVSERRAIAARCAGGAKWEDVMREFGVSRNTVARCVQEYGAVRLRRMSPEMEARVRSMAFEGRSVAEISAALGVSKNSITRAMARYYKQHGVQRRRGEPYRRVA